MANSYVARLNRLFGAAGGCLDVAIDHGVFNEHAFLNGLERMDRVVATLVNAGPDAIQMNFGQADLLQSMGRPKPGLVLRTDVGNPYNAVKHDVLFSGLQCENEPILPALQLDAACVVVNLLLIPGEPELHRQSILNIGRLRRDCDKYRMPLMIEPLVMQPNSARGGYMVDGDPKKIVPLVRQARELGADIIKADPTDRVEDYPEVIDAARCPVLVRGGGKADIREVFERAHAFLKVGASGLVYGRNIYQHPNPTRIVRAFMAMIHEKASLEQAWKIYSGE
ncbi:MAG TPA: hypothetical protein VG722_08830 [Tepidisphaeraceae bacterium]|nr:hypothetical protein [Tepidisphaeraceae bacterium]